MVSEVCKLNVVTQKRPGRPKKTWDEVLVDDKNLATSYLSYNFY